MNKTRTSTLTEEDPEAAPAPGDFAFIRAAAGFVLEDGPPGGVFTGPASAPPQAPATVVDAQPALRTESVERIDVPLPTISKAPVTPLAHRLMVFALIPFVLIAIGGLIMINRPGPRRPQPAPAPRVATTPTTTTPSPPAPVPETSVPTPASTVAVPTTRAPRSTPTTVTETTRPPATTPTTEAPTTTTTEPPTTTPTTEPPTTTPTTEPPTTTPTEPQPQLEPQPEPQPQP